MIARLATIPNRSFFLLGPRATGKTTWLRSQFPNAVWYNLLKSDEYIRLLQNPSAFRKEVLALKKDQWVIIDEIQRVPELLNEVHELLSLQQCKFILSGSSARKLKRNGVNLLAGRASTKEFFPLTIKELGSQFKLVHALRFGMLPDVWNSPQDAIDILSAYAETYLKEEIMQESLIKNLNSFSRFLEIASIMNGQTLFISSIAKDAEVARPTVQGYFDILTDTLIGKRLPAYRANAKVREAAHPKFYLFDCGIVRALSRKLREPIADLEKGFLFETLILNELRAYCAYTNCGGDLSYWRSGGKEVDFLWKRGASTISFEVKASERWRSEYSTASQELLSQGIINKGFGIYLGEKSFIEKDILVMPLNVWVEKLWDGELLSTS